MKVSYDNEYGTTYVFDVVDKIPEGYRIWNINQECISGYLPLCQVRPGSYSVIADTLKAIRMPVDEIVVLHQASVRYGANTLEKAEKILKRPGKSRKLIESAVDIFKKYS